jgi:hypothetical protein
MAFRAPTPPARLHPPMRTLHPDALAPGAGAANVAICIAARVNTRDGFFHVLDGSHFTAFAHTDHRAPDIGVIRR